MPTFKSPSPLQPVGFGAPDLNYALTPQLANQLQPISAPDTTGLQILGKAGDALQQTLQQQAQANKQEEQAANQLAQQQAAQQAAITQTTLASIQTRESSRASSSDSWGKLAGTAIGMVEGLAKQEAARRAAELKAELEVNQLKATTALENLQVEWIEGGLINKRGTLAYRKAVGDILGEQRLEPDTISSLTTRYYAPALDRAKQIDSNQVKIAEEVIVAEKNIVLETARLKLTTAFASMKSSDPTENSTAFERFNEVVKEVEADPKLDKVGKLSVTGNLLRLAVDSTGEGTELRKKIEGLQKYNNEASAFYNEYAPQVNDGTITDDQFYDWWNAIRAANNLPREDSPNTKRAEKAQNERNKLKQDVLAVNDAETKRAIDALPGNEVVTKALAAQMYLDPAVQALIKQDIDSGRADKNTRSAYNLSLEAVKFRDVEYVAFTKERAALTSRITSSSAASTKEFLEMQTATKGGGQAAVSIENLRNQLAGMGVGAGAGGTPERPVYSAEQTTIIQNARQQVINDIGEERAVLIRNWEDRETRMGKQGIFIDTRKTQQYVKQSQGAIDSFNKTVQNINNKPKLSPTATGQQPNFSSGMSRKPAVAPLMKTTYGGKTITVPFDISVADLSGGQKFHADRDGRVHDGLDFATPIGTPIKSLVAGIVVGNRVSAGGYGKSVEIRGDDGFTYFFAHLDKQLLPVGAKVGAGETLALSGNTGAGSGPHLHMEVWASKPGDAVPTSAEMIDPLLHLSTREFGDKVPMVRSANGRPSAAELPPGAHPLGGGDYLLNGRIVRGNQPNVGPATRTSTPASSGVDVFALPTANPDPTGNIPVKKGLELVGYVNTYKNITDKTMGVATYRNKAGGILTLTIPAPKNKKSQVPDTFGFDGRGFVAPQGQSTGTPQATPQALADSVKRGKAIIDRDGDRRIPGKDMPKRGKNEPSGLGKGKERGKGVPGQMSFNSFQPQPTSFSGDQYSAMVMSIFEAPTDQGRVDAIAVMVNRAGGNHHGNGTSLRSQVFASSQFEPVTKYDINPNAIQDRASALRVLTVNRGMSAAQAEAALSSVERSVVNPAMQRESEAKIGGKRFFKGVGFKQTGYQRTPNENTYHDEPGESYKTGTPLSRFFKQGGGGGPAPNTPIQQLPPGAIRTGPNNYFDPATKSIKVGSVYNSSSPFQSSYAPMSAVAYAPADNRDDFGYSQLKENPKIQEGVHGLAKKHGVPAQWVADAAMLKGTSGIDDNELEEMDALLARLKHTPKTTQQFLAAVLPEMDAKEANLALGVHGGRRYDSTFAALLRAQAPTHERRFKNCTMCAQLSRQEVFTPHKAEPIA